LALVGVFLYLKINETEPQLPEGIEDWSVGADIDFNMEGEGPIEIPQFDHTAANEGTTFSQAPSAVEAPEPTPPIAEPSPVAMPEASSNAAAEYAAAEYAATEYAATEYDGQDGVDEGSATRVVSPPQTADFPPLPPLPQGVAESPVAESSFENQTQVSPLSEESMVASAEQAAVTTPTTTVPSTAESTSRAQSSLFSATRKHVQAALDRGELSQALLLLSDWYGDPSLSPSATE